MSPTPSVACDHGPSTCRAASRRRAPTGGRRRVSRTTPALPRSSRKCAMQMADVPYDLPDAHGHFGPYGGVFVAETLISALDELRADYESARRDPAFRAEFEDELAHYV